MPAAFAGPSEVVVIGDDTVPAELCAIDIVVQAEHGPGGLAWLITWDEAVADAVDAAIAEIVAGAERRADIESTLAEGGYTVAGRRPRARRWPWPTPSPPSTSS